MTIRGKIGKGVKRALRGEPKPFRGVRPTLIPRIRGRKAMLNYTKKMDNQIGNMQMILRNYRHVLIDGKMFPSIAHEWSFSNLSINDTVFNAAKISTMLRQQLFHARKGRELTLEQKEDNKRILERVERELKNMRKRNFKAMEGLQEE